ncbi:hypothetical protein [Pseudonocardia sp. McavD-2-B]|uniref:hypothetical protein n=1 Tax=Pseudonocardia sp. McavD-2-B TaxID=2954499 RepID=UPI0020980750|nr:hypothetical protein [Pseudonocardia sp. McavD-2-B]MCO7195636.1 hypothetical protein [Pseudonocardia sp. McavD-2-B]
MSFDPHDRPIYEQVAGELLFTPDGDAVPTRDAGADDDLVVWTDNGDQPGDPVEQPPQDPRWIPRGGEL